MTLRRWCTLLRSAGVGLVATATDLALLAILVGVFAVPLRLASVIALSSGIAVQFVGNKLVAFSDRSPAWLRQGIQFLGVETLGFIANLVLYDIAVTHTHLPYLPLRLLTTTVVYFCLCLPLWSHIFRSDLAPLSSA
jgi:putative flippase GtrA